MKITATVVYTVCVEIDVDPDQLETNKGVEAIQARLRDEADSYLSDAGGATPIIHEASDERLID